MEIILAIAALALLIVSFLGLLKVICRIFAVLCVIGAVWFWSSGGKEKLVTGLETGISTVLEQAADLGGEDRRMLEAALRNPESVLGPQKQRIREILFSAYWRNPRSRLTKAQSLWADH